MWGVCQRPKHWACSVAPVSKLVCFTNLTCLPHLLHSASYNYSKILFKGVITFLWEDLADIIQLQYQNGFAESLATHFEIATNASTLQFKKFLPAGS